MPAIASAVSLFMPLKMKELTISFFSPEHTFFLTAHSLACPQAPFLPAIALIPSSLSPAPGSSLNALESSHAEAQSHPFLPACFSRNNKWQDTNHTSQE